MCESAPHILQLFSGFFLIWLLDYTHLPIYDIKSIFSVFGILEYSSADEALAARIGLQAADFYTTKGRIRSDVVSHRE